MANTITFSAALQVAGTGIGISGSAAPTPAAQVGTRGLGNVQTVGTSWEVINIGDLTIGYLLVVNTDSTNYVELTADGASGLKIFAQVKAGEVALIPCSSSATYGARANTASCECRIIGVER